MFLKRLFYASASILLLAFSWQIGQRAVAATGPSGPTEVVTLSGVLSDGQTIPLPVYADGTTALESDCKWTVSPAWIDLTAANNFWCSTTGRVVSVGTDGSPRTYLHQQQANYLIIATPGSSGPTPARAQSFGSLKAKYR